MQPVPLFDPAADWQASATAAESGVLRVLASGKYVLEETVADFEQAFAAYLDIAHVVGVASGSDALLLALRALGIGPGDEVIVPAFGFIATATAVLHAGATPVFADVEAARYTLDTQAAATCIGARTRALIGVDLYGLPANWPGLRALAGAHGLALIEDAAQATGARLGDHAAGTLADIAGFSFYPTKNLGAAGDAGALATADPDLYSAVLALRNHGSRERFLHERVGYNSRLDAIQAAVLLARLPQLEANVTRRRQVAENYRAALSALPLILPTDFPATRHAYSVYCVGCHNNAERERLRTTLTAAGIGAASYYPLALHQQPIFSAMRHASLPVAEHAAATLLALPIYPSLAENAFARICAVLRKAYGHPSTP